MKSINMKICFAFLILSAALLFADSLATPASSISGSTVPSLGWTTGITICGDYVITGTNQNAISVFSLDPSTAKVTFANSITTSKSGWKYLVSKMLPNGNGMVYSYNLDGSLEAYHLNQTTGILTLVKTLSIPASGYFLMAPDYRYLYIVSPSGSTLAIDSVTGIPTVKSTTTYAAPPPGKDFCFFIPCMAPDGKNIYAPAGDGINIYSVNPATGAVSFLSKVTQTGGTHYFGISADGKNLYEQISFGTALRIYDRNLSTGALTYKDTCDFSMMVGTIQYNFNSDGRSGYFISLSENMLGGASVSAVGWFLRDPTTGDLTYKGKSDVGGAYDAMDLDPVRGIMVALCKGNPSNFVSFKTPASGTPLPFALNCSDPVKLAADVGAANPQIVIPLTQTKDTAIPVITTTTDSAWLTAAVNGTGIGQTITLTANISGRASGLYHAWLTVSGEGYPYKLRQYVELRINGAPQPATLKITPDASTILIGETSAFNASVVDQFGDPFAGTVDWTVSGGGSINASGLFTSDGTPGSFTVTAAVHNTPSVTGSASLVVRSDVPSGNITVTATSAQAGNEASKAIDNNTSTFWHSQWSPALPLPQSITLILQQPSAIQALRYLPRQDGTLNGTITSYKILAGDDSSALTQVASGTWANDNTEKRVAFTAVTARYIRLTAVEGTAGFASAAEIHLERGSLAVEQAAGKLPCAFSLSVAGSPGNRIQITFSMPRAGAASLKLYDLRGRLVRTLVEGHRTAGYYTVAFGNTESNPLVNNIYLCRLQADGVVKTIKIFIMR